MSAMKMIVTGVFCLTAAALQAATLQVGPDKAYKTIQAAVDAANTAGGDVIEVDEGTYTSDNTTTYFIDIEKPVTVKAVGARDNTKIVCPKDYYGVKVNAEGAVLSGFTFETLSSKEVLRVSAGTVTNCAALAAFKPTVGKVVYVEKTGVIDDCTFKDVYINSANLGNGGAMYVMGGTIRNCLFDHVYADIGGGAGIAMRMDGEGLVSNCVFRSCSATGPNVGDGGCAALYVTKGTVADCRIYGNSFRGGCAGVCMGGGTMLNSLIYDNVATNCYSQTDGGAGLRMSDGTVRNCTITRNRTLYDPEGRGFSGVQMSKGTLTNCVVYGNIGGDLRKTGGKAVYCCFGQDVEGDGNLNADPRFANPAAKDFTLNATSPCVGAGGSGDDMGYQQLTEAQKTAPAIGFSADKTFACGASAEFTFTASGVNGAGTDYVWDFGDGSAGAGAEVTHAYAPGDYTVTLTCGGLSYARTNFIRVAPKVCHVWAEGSDTAPYDTKEKGARDPMTAVEYGSEEVDVHPGTYKIADKFASITLPRKVTMRGVGDRDDIMFDGQGKEYRRVVILGHPEAVLDNVTIKRGSHIQNHGGSGCYIWAGTLTNCVVTGCTHHNGGAVFMCGGRMTGCRVTKNEHAANGNCGGGLSVGPKASDAKEQDVLVDNCQFDENKQKGTGGAGAYVSNSKAVVSNCVFTGNSDNCYPAGECGGAGVYLNKGLVTNCRIEGNTTVRHGGGAFVAGGTLRNCLIVGNTGSMAGTSLGGGIYQKNGTVENCTVVGNEAKAGGSGIYQLGGDIHNSIVYFNTTDNAVTSGGTATHTCSTPALTGEGNTAVDPGFGETYHLTSLSKCKDAGLNLPWMDGAVDLDGTNRIVNTTVDMGCYEFVPSSDEPFTVQFSAETVSGSGSLTATFVAEVTKYDAADCTFTWTFSDGGEETVVGSGTVQHTFAPGTFSVSVVVTKGTESCETSRDDYITVSPDVCYVSKDGSAVKPYATWATAANTLDDALKTGAGTIYVSNGVYEVTETVSLDRKVKVVGVNGPASVRIRRTASYKVTQNLSVMSVSSSEAWLEGVTLSHGLWNMDDSLGGNTLRLSAGTVTNCVISEGEGYKYGAAAVRGGLLVDCVISNCLGSSSGSTGGALSVFDGGVVSGCRITDCRSNYGAGTGTYADAGQCAFIDGGTVTNCTFDGNWSVRSDGVIGAINLKSGLVTHCFITNNTAGGRVGGVCVRGGTLRNCLIAGNSSNGTSDGDGGCGISQNAGTVENCTITANRSPAPGAGAKVDGGTFVNNIVWGNGSGADVVVADGATVTKCLFENPLFASAEAGDYRLTAFSKAIDAGQDADWMLTSPDLAGASRLVGAAVDAGAYEFAGGAEGLACHFDVTTVRNADYSTTASFAAEVRGASGEVAFFWTWGDGSAETEDTATPTHVYQPGKYTVTLRVVDEKTETSETRVDVVVAVPHVMTVAVGESIQEAIDSGADEVVLAAGVHEISEGVFLTREVILRGETGNPADTVVYAPSSYQKLRVAKVSHAGAVVRDLTLRGGNVQTPNDMQAGSVLWLESGSVDNCILENGLCYYKAPVWVEGGALTRSVIRNGKVTSSSAMGVGLGMTGGLVDSCVISNNCSETMQHEALRGGAYVAGTGILRNSLVCYNRTAIGAGIAVESEDAQVENCTVVMNTANIRTGGVLTTVQPAVLRNLIVWGNEAPEFAELNDPSAFSYSCSPALTAGVNHNLAGDPLFRRPAKGDWRLRGGSPCVGTGLVEGWMSSATDLRGRARKIGGAVSMGAYECMPNGLSVIVR